MGLAESGSCPTAGFRVAREGRSNEGRGGVGVVESVCPVESISNCSDSGLPSVLSVLSVLGLSPPPWPVRLLHRSRPASNQVQELK